MSGTNHYCMAIETTRELFSRLLDCGVDADVLVAKSGIALDQLKPAEKRFPVAKHLSLWQAAEDLSDHSALGLSMGAASRPNNRGIVGLVFAASRDLETAVGNKIRYSKILADHISLELVKSQNEFSISYSILGGLFHRYEIERVFAGFFNWVRIFVGQNIAPTRLLLQYSEPDNTDAYAQHFPCPVLFDQAQNTITFSNDIWHCQNPQYNDYLYSILQSRAEEILGRLNTQADFISSVHNTIASRLCTGNFKARDIADAHHISIRTFHRRLKEQGVTYQSVLDDVRKELALSYLQNGQCNQDTIPYLLGYSDQTAFQRAFKRWLGTSPKRYTIAS
ncbi:MAG TPA: hypothetical protein DD979_14215 [Gammaproteobacteria bacterium]|jgi:AraC-like DNA-binding protein|nr:hypothetical protein [Gammaproteobacteria bacterium]